MKNFLDTEFVIFDVETTGLSPQMGDRVVEVAALRVKGLQAVSQFHSLVNPGRDISSSAYLVNGISPQMLLGAPTSAEVFPDLLEYLSGAVIVGHNIKFDLDFLNAEAARLGMVLSDEIQSLCTVAMSKAFLPELGRHALSVVAYHLGIETPQEHRALSDVYMTYDVLKKLFAIADRKDIGDLQTLVTLFGHETQKKKERLQQTMLAIEQAIRSNQMLQISYFSSEQSAMTFRKVTPTKIVKRRGSWNLQGFCHLRASDRIFRIDKILELNPIS